MRQPAYFIPVLIAVSASAISPPGQEKITRIRTTDPALIAARGGRQEPIVMDPE